MSTMMKLSLGFVAALALATTSAQASAAGLVVDASEREPTEGLNVDEAFNGFTSVPLVTVVASYVTVAVPASAVA